MFQQQSVFARLQELDVSGATPDHFTARIGQAREVRLQFVHGLVEVVARGGVRGTVEEHHAVSGSAVVVGLGTGKGEPEQRADGENK